MKIFGRRPAKIHPEDLDRQTAEVNAKLEREGEHMNALAQYLINRKDQNGFGEDFDLSLRPRGAQ